MGLEHATDVGGEQQAVFAVCVQMFGKHLCELIGQLFGGCRDGAEDVGQLRQQFLCFLCSVHTSHYLWVYGMGLRCWPLGGALVMLLVLIVRKFRGNQGICQSLQHFIGDVGGFAAVMRVKSGL